MTTTDSAKGQPFVLMVSHALTGHLAPMIRIASALHARDWPVSFLGPTAHRSRIEASGAVFFPLRADADLDDKLYYERPPTADYSSLPWWERVLVDLERQCVAPLVTQWECVKAALEALHARDPARQVLVLAEAFFLGVLPLRHGAPLPAGIRRPRSICVSVTVPAIRSRDLPPFGYPFPFDMTPEGRARNARLWERSWARRAAPLTALLESKMREAGATGAIDEIFLSGGNYTCHERILQLGVPGLEYPRSDWPPGFRFAGLVQGPPRRQRSGSGSGSQITAKEPDFPWWPELVANSALGRGDPRRRKVVVVTQGTVEIDPRDLIMPTIEAFAGPRHSGRVLVVAILGWKDASLDPFATTERLPANARVADYLSYDAALAHADAWVHNGGFGAVGHGVAHGVPQVVAGEGMDKTENARRVAGCGAGVDLGTPRPTAEAVREAVERVLFREDGSDGDGFAERVAALRRESEALDCFAIVDEELRGLIESERSE
ncbi:hypothetical protein DL764_001866 [Monosporascus ibericus]|uniref:Erythromycin biosynthesis protein CIII-like C-terminal domain-containing protein n=1 Tax=Monosporascus ibericus TaxID=155417 RepID=A0A4Q4TMX4_9PEZI|nr:hypothetical protein DL764_001866 [Monosporascus ibericus]